VPVDRDETLKKAEKLLKQGKVAAAIEEYVRLVDDKPSDWNTANTLGDLYVKAGDAQRAAEQFNRAADHLYGEGFFPRASAVYKKVLKVSSGDDHALWQLADIAGRNGLSLDARSYYSRLIQDRRAAGNEDGAVDCLVRIGQLEDASLEARRVAANALVDRGETKQAARILLSAADALMKDGRLPEALEGLKEAAQLDPEDQEIREKLKAVTPGDDVATMAALAEPVDATVAADDNAVVHEAVVAEPVVAAPNPDAVADEPLPLETFFEELRGKVARDQEVRAREHFEEGLRHLDENRHDEAIASLEEAVRTPALRFEAASHLARAWLGRGDLQMAVDWMERALEAPAPPDGDRLALMYELADTLARQGETSRAMALFMEVESDVSGYRDVRERITRLSQAEIGNP
jgi:tetratricopeptide (TPR) repeat protein